MVKILHDLKDPRLWYLRYIPYFGSCRILAINRSKQVIKLSRAAAVRIELLTTDNPHRATHYPKLQTRNPQTLNPTPKPYTLSSKPLITLLTYVRALVYISIYVCMFTSVLRFSALLQNVYATASSCCCLLASERSRRILQEP